MILRSSARAPQPAAHERIAIGADRIRLPALRADAFRDDDFANDAAADIKDAEPPCPRRHVDWIRGSEFDASTGCGRMNLDWRIFALGSALFAALTAIFGKIGVSQLNSDLATLIRTVVILIVTALIIWAKQEWQRPENLPATSIIFLALSGIATGLSWLCYYRALQLGPASRVAPIDKLSVVLVVFFSVVFLGESLTWKLGLGALLITAGAALMAF